MSTTDAVAFRDGVYAARPPAGGPQPSATEVTDHVLLIRRTA